jgi:hypothetical protein
MPDEWGENDLLTIQDFAKYMRLSVRSLRERLAEGDAPAPVDNLAKTPRWLWRDIRDWVGHARWSRELAVRNTAKGGETRRSVPKSDEQHCEDDEDG